jgi:hypothetical protein
MLYSSTVHEQEQKTGLITAEDVAVMLGLKVPLKHAVYYREHVFTRDLAIRHKPIGQQLNSFPRQPLKAIEQIFGPDPKPRGIGVKFSPRAPYVVGKLHRRLITR